MLYEVITQIEAWPSGRPCRVIVVGGGAAGVELAGNVRRLLERHGLDGRVTLVTGDTLLAGWPDGLVDKLRDYFRRRSVTLKEGATVAAYHEHSLELSDGQQLPYDFALVATGIKPPQLFRDSSLSVGPDA